MKMAEYRLISASPYSQSRFHNVPSLPGEQDQAKEERTWRERCHYDENGQIFIPPSQLNNNIKEAAKYLNMRIPGRNRETWTKHFEAGVLVTDKLYIGYHKDTVQGEWLYMGAHGRRNDNARVLRCYPYFPKWEGKVIYYILDNLIDQEIFQKVIETAGLLIGIGRFRPAQRGYYGRFKAELVEWVDQ